VSAYSVVVTMLLIVLLLSYMTAILLWFHLSLVATVKAYYLLIKPRPIKWEGD